MTFYRTREDSAHERANLLYTGRMEGIEKGIEKGKIQIAQNMLSENMSLELIAKITGLSMEKIKKLQANSNDKSH